MLDMATVYFLNDQSKEDALGTYRLGSLMIGPAFDSCFSLGLSITQQWNLKAIVYDDATLSGESPNAPCRP
jgi:hypothetical protein